jgi:hypothetical protein
LGARGLFSVGHYFDKVVRHRLVLFWRIQVFGISDQLNSNGKLVIQFPVETSPGGLRLQRALADESPVARGSKHLYTDRTVDLPPAWVRVP